jgi:hypothetical protein
VSANPHLGKSNETEIDQPPKMREQSASRLFRSASPQHDRAHDEDERSELPQDQGAHCDSVRDTARLSPSKERQVKKRPGKNIVVRFPAQMRIVADAKTQNVKASNVRVAIS